MKKTKRLIFAAFVLALSLAITVTSTFAWFIRGSNPEISSFELEALSNVPNLLISLNQSETQDDWISTDGYMLVWGQNDFQTIMKAAGILDNNNKAARMGAFTTDNGITFKDEAGAPAGLDIFNNQILDESTGSVFQFKIRFRSDEKNLQVALHTDSKIKTGSITSTKPVFGWKNLGETFNAANYGIKDYLGNDVFTLATDKAIYLSSAYAARLSFLDYTGSIASGTYAKAETPSANIWNPQETKSIDDTFKKQNTDYYTIEDREIREATEVVEGTAEVTKNFAADYKNTIISTTALQQNTPRNTIDKTSIDKTTIVTLDVEKEFGGVNYYFGEITLNIWLEGWDTSCTNSILSSFFSVYLKFTRANIQSGD